MAVASKNLFHFTSQYDTLVKILEGKAFWPRYCCEYDWFTDKSKVMSIPMVCFTDIPLVQTSEHVDFYGHYGIGLTKTWASSKFVCPVWYVKQKTLRIILNVTSNTDALKDPHIIDILTFSKHATRGRCKNRSGDIKQKEFYEEREWRYVPPVVDKKKLIVGKIGETLGNNEDTKSFLLSYSLGDIRYLLVDTEEDRLNLINDIDRIFSSTETQESIALLKSRILTIEQLKQDF